MIANVGNLDRIARIVIGLALIIWAITGGPIWAWLGILPLSTGLSRRCPAYSLLGYNGCSSEKK
jgi:hypothetical protein